MSDRIMDAIARLQAAGHEVYRVHDALGDGVVVTVPVRPHGAIPIRFSFQVAEDLLTVIESAMQRPTGASS